MLFWISFYFKKLNKIKILKQNWSKHVLITNIYMKNAVSSYILKL